MYTHMSVYKCVCVCACVLNPLELEFQALAGCLLCYICTGPYDYEACALGC